MSKHKFVTAREAFAADYKPRQYTHYQKRCWDGEVIGWYSLKDAREFGYRHGEIKTTLQAREAGWIK